MTDANWGSSEAPVKKSGLPKWMLWCGGGCLLALVLGGIAAFALFKFGKAFVEEARDSEKQWPKLQQLLPFDERPAGYELGWGSSFLMETYVLKDQKGLVGVVMRFNESDSESVDAQLMNPEFSGSFMGMGGRKDLKKGAIEMQGASFDVLRFHQTDAGGGPAGGDGSQAPAFSAYVRLTEAGDTRPVVVQLIAIGATEPIPDEQIREYFAPFHVGRK